MELLRILLSVIDNYENIYTINVNFIVNHYYNYYLNIFYQLIMEKIDSIIDSKMLTIQNILTGIDMTKTNSNDSNTEFYYNPNLVNSLITFINKAISKNRVLDETLMEEMKENFIVIHSY